MSAVLFAGITSLKVLKLTRTFSGFIGGILTGGGDGADFFLTGALSVTVLTFTFFFFTTFLNDDQLMLPFCTFSVSIYFLQSNKLAKIVTFKFYEHLGNGKFVF